jgi:hypothetical protein
MGNFFKMISLEISHHLFFCLLWRQVLVILPNQGNIDPDIKVRNEWYIQRNQAQVLFIFYRKIVEFLFQAVFAIKKL